MFEPAESKEPLVAVVMAAGNSSRFGDEDKLLFPLDGVPVVEHVLKLLRKFCRQQQNELAILMVVSNEQRAINTLAQEYGAQTVLTNPQVRGMGHSIACAATYLLRNKPGCRGVAVFLGDMPKVQTSTVCHIVEVFDANDRQKIVRPRFGNEIGHPVVFPSELIGELARLGGDNGANAVIRKFKERLLVIDVDDEGCVFDIDVPNDL